MNRQYNLFHWLRIGHILTIMAVMIILIMAFFLQIYRHEAPCPLCLMQRLGLFTIAFGLFLNLHFGYQSFNYAISLIGALYALIVAGYQVTLHILPGNPGYASPFMGLHLYTLSSLAMLIFLSIMIIFLLFSEQFTAKFAESSKMNHNFLANTTTSLTVIFVILALLNIYTTYHFCGFGLCPP